jgi:hypothetical protein
MIEVFEGAGEGVSPAIKVFLVMGGDCAKFGFGATGGDDELVIKK